MAVVQNLELRAIQNFFGEIELIFKRREKGVSLDLAFDESQEQIRTLRQSLCVNLRSTADKNLSVASQSR